MLIASTLKGAHQEEEDEKGPKSHSLELKNQSFLTLNILSSVILAKHFRYFGGIITL